MKKGIAIAGNLGVDYIKFIESYPAPQTLTTITDTDRSTGGLCCNCVLILARLDPSLPITAIGLVGHDGAGDYILSQFAGHANIDTSRIRRQGATAYTDVMTEQNSGRRTFFHFRGADALFGPEHIDFANLEADILHIGYISLLDKLDAADSEYPTVMCRVLNAAQKAGLRTSIDAVSGEEEHLARLIPPALQYADYCTINELEASRATGILLRDSADNLLADNLPKVCRTLLDMGIGKWVILHSPELSCGMERGGEYIQKPSWKLPPGFIKSSVGAGDAFASGILYGAYQGWNMEKSMHIAGAIAAYSLSGAGASDAIKPLPELLGEMLSPKHIYTLHA
ncbi:MAG: carbohydrate kinase family protein [Treponema sp.]|jgi:sugar/nucleoside kinase (ribokinase family)|nr:carbohydrate kinase family protein [Treponema sp.]